ncbi:MAG: sensor domain-containing diguanylate cyclase [Polyangiales bacterium]
MRIIELASSPEVDLQAIGTLARVDPAFALRVLATVNSPLFALRTRVESVKHAVTLLGARGIRNVALSLMLRDMEPPDQLGRILIAQSLRRAVAARMVAQLLGRRDLDVYATAGLLLESGLLIRARTEPAACLEATEIPALHRVVWERANGDVGHPKHGANFARSLSLSDAIVRSIELHHNRVMPSGDVESVCWAAEQVAAVYEGDELERAILRAGAALKALGLSADQAEHIIEKVPALTAQAAEVMECEVPPQHSCRQLRDQAYERLLHTVEEYEVLVRSLERVLEEKDRLARELQGAKDQLTVLSLTDALTGLANRRAYMDTLERTCNEARRDRCKVTAAIIDVDHFKKVNDTYGHPTGDMVLQHIASTLCLGLPDDVLLARLGGEEMTLVLPNRSLEEAKALAESLRARLADTPCKVDDLELRVTASFGVATLDPRGLSDTAAADKVLADADAALYMAKGSGRNCVVVHRPQACEDRA